MRHLIRALLSLYLFIYVFAVPMLMLDWVPIWGTWMGGFLLILQGSLLTLWLGANAGGRGLMAAACIAALSCAVEYVGVTTGVPFGRYTYTDTLGLKVGGAVPLPIPFAWLLVVPATIGMARMTRVGSRWIVVVGPLLALGLDLLLEPVAAYVTNYWHWIDSGPYYGVPTANFAAWGATAFTLTAITLGLCGKRIIDPPVLPLVPALVYVLNVLQFTLVDLAYGYLLAAFIGAALLLMCGWWMSHELRALSRAAQGFVARQRRFVRVEPE